MTATMPKPTVKVAMLTASTTDVVRRLTSLAREQGQISVGRTVLTFHTGTDDAIRLVDWMIKTEIPGSGASSKEVRKLRELRRRLVNLDGVKVTTAAPAGGLSPEDRGKVLDIIAEMWSGAAEKDWYEAVELAEYATGDMNPSLDKVSMREVRDWLEKVL